MRYLIILPVLCLFNVVAAGEDDTTDGLLQSRLEAHIEFLADDLMLGRQPGTPQYNIAANYVASQFRQIGLRPAGDGGSYLQQVPMLESRQVPGSAVMSITHSGETTPLVFVEQFFIGPSQAHLESSLDAELVFVGYGIEAPELGHDDYVGLDVSGKVVVIIGGQPQDFPSEEGAHFASGRERVRAAMEAGAIGILSVYTPRNESQFQWGRLSSRVGMPSMGWLTEGGEVFASPDQIRVSSVVHYDHAGMIFEGAEVDLLEILRRDGEGDPVPGFALHTRVTMSQQSRHEKIFSPNVVALLPGSDPTLSGEFVVYTAHLDHIGVSHTQDHEDSINNGAMDNASGVSVMLETARLFAERGAPRRSILFVAVTAEEKGMVGSEYFARNPTVPASEMVAVINLDMPVLLYDFGDVIAFGASHSSLGETVQQAAGEAGIALTPDPFPEKNVFVRSDHYRFVQRGIPSVFLVTGLTDREGEDGAPPVMERFLQEHYHQPSDDLGLPIRYDQAARFTRINARIGEIIANESERPTWHEGDFFGETFGR